MPKTKIVFFETFGNNKKYLSSKLSKSFDVDFVAEPLTEENVSVAKSAEIIGVFVESKVSKLVISKLVNLKLIVTLSTGFDHIDIVASKAKGVTVCNVPSYGENTVAEHAFALILAISRKLFESNKKLKDGGFYGEDLMGFDLQDKTLGILGCGNIGRHLAKMAYGFGMKVVAYDLNCDLEFGAKYEMEYAPDVDSVFKKADIVSLHMPLNDHTKHIINKDSISIMKSGVVIINTARGGLIETKSLYEGLLSEKIHAVGIDVFEEENYFKNEIEELLDDNEEVVNYETVLLTHKLINHPRVIATPHNAFNSKEAVKRIMDTTIKNILNYKLKTPSNIVK